MKESTNKIYFELWEDFKASISYRNRFFNNHKILEHIEKLVAQSVITLSKEDILYRARIYNGELGYLDAFERMIKSSSKKEKESDNTYASLLASMNEHDLNRRIETGFWGHNAEGSHTPKNPEVVVSGRANPEKIVYLYLAKNPMGAVAEVRPLIGDHISVAEVKVLDDLKIADLSYDLLSNANKQYEMLAYIILNEFSRPNDKNQFDYLATQFISEYIKSLNYDGIKYSSSLYGRGRNYVIFNAEKCIPIASKLYKLNEVCLDLECVGPVGDLLGDNDLYHWKLDPYKKQEKENLIKKLKKI